MLTKKARALRTELDKIPMVDAADIEQAILRSGCWYCGLVHFVRMHQPWLASQRVEAMAAKLACEHQGAHNETSSEQTEIRRIIEDNAQLELKIAANDWKIETIRRQERRRLEEELMSTEWKLNNLGPRSRRV